MDHRRVETILHHLRQWTGSQPALADGQLLERFAGQRDEAAFELLVRRHGPLVWNVCHRLLGNAHDAEDAFQAVFLILLRKASALDRTGTVAPWLYGVACRVALRARARRGRDPIPLMNEPGDHGSSNQTAELRRILDEEVNRLPERYRAPVVLCYFQGRTHEEAARELHWPLGTVKCRIMRAREWLRVRLTRRGLTLASGALAAMMSAEGLRAAMPPLLIESTVAAGLAGTVPAAALAEGVLRAMFLTKLAKITVSLVAVLGLGLGVAGLLGEPAAPGVAPINAAEPVLPGIAAEDTAPAAPASADPLAGPWADLASDDEAKALRAVLTFARDSKAAVAFFKQHLHPVLVDAKRIARRIADLDSAEFAVRAQASADLENFGEYALPYLQAALEGNPPLEVRQRVADLLYRLKQPRLPAGWVRSVRAIAVLEAIGGDEARTILEALARGRARAVPTQEAEVALDRLAAHFAVPVARRWGDLSSTDEARVAQALLALATRPKETLQFLQEQLKGKTLNVGVANDITERVNRLIVELGSNRFDVREKASQQLGALGQAAVPALMQAVNGPVPLPLETRRRIEELIFQARLNQRQQAIQAHAELLTGKVAGPAPQPPAPALAITAVLVQRAEVLLGHIGTREAAELLAAFKAAAQIKSTRDALSSDGKLRAHIDTNGRITLSDPMTGKILSYHDGTAQCLAFAPDSKLLVYGSATSTLSILETATGKLVRQIKFVPAGGIVAVSVSPDGSRLSANGADGTVAEFELATGKQLR
ncbi:hypothetical protein AYO44_01880 [Planctomycetaceae bacterium SCGC AG-212-F19]|nr:hypothetical protein AYO44_01880 [Planctomycetaceae bacterium SCGC AG-212-F19]